MLLGIRAAAIYSRRLPAAFVATALVRPTPVFVEQRRPVSRNFFDTFLSLENPLVEGAYNVLLTTHELSGLPWWASIAVTAWALRSTITLPLFAFSRVNQSRLRKLKPELDGLSAELRQEVLRASKLFGWSEREAKRRYNKRMQELCTEAYAREKCSPYMNIALALVQVPLWLTMSFALRNLCGAFFIDGYDISHLVAGTMKHEGALWFTDLTTRDTTFALPVLFGLTNMAIVEVQGGHGWQKNVFRLLSLVLVPLSAAVPSAMTWYWLCSSLFGLVQNVVVRFIIDRKKGQNS